MGYCCDELGTYFKNVEDATSQENRMNDSQFVKKLSDVFDFFLDIQKPIADDTCLQRLLDILKEKFSDTECKSGSQFIKKACEKIDNLESSIVTFALQLAGQEAQKEGLIVSRHLYETISNKGLWKDISIGTSYFDSLSQVAGTSNGWTWLTEEKDYVEQAVQSLQEDTSLFLHSSARKLITMLLKTQNQFKMDAEERKPGCRVAICHLLSEDIHRELRQAADSPDRPLTLYLENLLSILVSSEGLLQEIYDEEVVHNMLRICLGRRSGSSSLCGEALMKCLCLCQQRGNYRLDDFMKRFLDHSIDGLKQGNVCKYHKLAVKIHQSFTELAVCGELQEIVLLPYSIMLGEPPLSVGSSLLQACRQAMMNKAQCIQLLLHTTDCLPLKDGDLQMMLELLELTHLRVDVPVADHLSNDIRQNVVDNKRLQLSLLDKIHCNIGISVPVAMITKALDVIMEIASGTFTDNTLQQKGFDCVLSLLRLLATAPNGSEHLTNYLPLVVRQLDRHLVSTQWENRDTAVEAVIKLASLHNIPAAGALLSSSHILGSAWQCVSDSDSYVRASAIRLIATVVMAPQLCDAFLSQLKQTEADIVHKLTEIIKTDSEAFPRRAAVSSLQAIHSSRSIPEPVVREIFSSMVQAMADFDWEVKANTLDFWQYVCDQEIKSLPSDVPDYVVNLLPSGTKRKLDNGSTLTHDLFVLSQTGFCEAVISGTEDYDNHVQEKSYKILKNLKGKINDDVDENKLKKLKVENGDETNGSHPVNSEPELSTARLTTFLQLLRDTDIELKLSVLSGSADEYSKNPLALLEDILSEDKDIEDDKFVDCY
ncbi:BRCA1-associated ATM activator 1-like [Haliotis cracherodii]|uniref:BRCA1-associated ATM activator 1-like n=1 Tax=Haliotis cracherodii TaxID=6455 RepID=UPI0039EBEBFE